jgi:gamma-glutamylcyclotransferase (GGCT)/AIG2-like uncharacterized protein YtfP
MNSLLFVYGTLLSRARHPMGARLGREARLLGEATIQGRLYSLGRYPGLVESPGRQYAVHGEVYDLENPVASLGWLDAYEGIVPGAPDKSPYERVERPVRLMRLDLRLASRLASDGTLTAWVYLYRKSVSRLPEVLGGSWMSWAPPEN